MTKLINKTELMSKLCDKFYGGNKSEMCRAFGRNPQVGAQWFKRGSITLEEIYAQLPQLNPEWLLTGEGAMLKEEGDATN